MEMWTPDEKPNLTWSHPWASAPGFIIPWFLFGVNALLPGWASMSIKPAVGTLDHGALKLPTIKGPVTAQFESLEGRFTLSIQLPLGVTALVSLPRPRLHEDAGAGVQILWNGRPSGFALQDDGYLAVDATVSSGSHTFSVMVPTPPARNMARGAAVTPRNS